jgi:L-alanine-DL-glutamate epimerase-like enolase superfamily enzyme
MKITEIVTNIVRPSNYDFRWGDDQPVVPVALTFVRIRTDDGQEGCASSWLPGAHSEVAETIALFTRHSLLGRDPFHREAIWQEMMKLTRNTVSPKAASVVDIALWDLAGKILQQPIYRLLGAHSDQVKAYASTTTYSNVSDYVDIALQSREDGFQALKLHAFGDPERDIEVCRAVRAAVGDDMRLMLDPVNSYDFLGAQRVGHVLDELGFYWFEAPTHDEDIPGLRRLTEELRTPVATGESLVRGIWDFPTLLTNNAGDMIRCIGDAMGGITGMRKVGALCETFNRNLETHAYGSTLVQAAHLHFILSVANSEYFELPIPSGMLDFGMVDTIESDDAGYVHAPTAAGLGYAVDWDVIEAATVERKVWAA